MDFPPMGLQTHNPHDLTRGPSGSSGGTGAAIAAGFAQFGLGTDTAGPFAAHRPPTPRRPSSPRTASFRATASCRSR